MQTKLTLRLDKLLIERAKIYAGKHNKSISQVVADYFVILNHVIHSKRQEDALPITHSLRGVLKGKKISEQDYKKHLEDKYL